MGLTASCLWQCVAPLLTKYEVPDEETDDFNGLEPAHPTHSSTQNGSIDGVLPPDINLDEEAQKEEESREGKVQFRMETMSSATNAKFQVAIVLAFVIVDTFTALLFAQKFAALTSNETFADVRTWFKVQLALVCAFFAVMLVCGASWAYRIHLCRRQHKTWSKRQNLFFFDALILFSLQSVAMVLVIAPQIMGIVMTCPWFRVSIAALAFLRFTILNMQLAWMCFMMRGMMLYRGQVVLPNSDHQLIIDAPWSAQNHANLGMSLLFWMMEGTIIGKLVYRLRDPQKSIPNLECEYYDFDCSSGTGETVFNILSTAFILAYAVLYIVLVMLARRDHRKVPFFRYRVSYLYVEMHAQHGIFIVVLLLSVTVVLRFIDVTSCWSFIDVQFGIIPTQLAITVLVCVILVLMAPSLDNLKTMQERWPYEISWTEGQRRSMVLAREGEEAQAARQSASATPERTSAFGSMLQHLSMSRASMRQNTQAMIRAVLRFDAASETVKGSPARALLCIETLIKMLYFCKLTYNLDRPDPLTDTDYALSLYPMLEEHELLVEESTDTRAFLAWGPGILVVAFRGTVTRKNLITDLKAWSTPHEPNRKNSLGLTLRVHAGFYRAWRTGDFGEKLLRKAESLLNRWPGASKVIFTGHSLGGALAILASSEFVRRYPQYQPSVSVYTFGSPRVGNGPFASEHLAAVPDTWTVINNQDPVPRIPKGWYHCSGHRVVINPHGDVIIRPSMLDISAIFRSAGVAADHRLPGYSLSLFAILRAQFDEAKRMPRGARGVLELTRSIDVGKTLLLKGAGLAQIMNPGSRTVPMPLEIFRRRRTKHRHRRTPSFRTESAGVSVSSASSQATTRFEDQASRVESLGFSTATRQVPPSDSRTLCTLTEAAEPEREERDALTEDVERSGVAKPSIIERALSFKPPRLSVFRRSLELSLSPPAGPEPTTTTACTIDATVPPSRPSSRTSSTSTTTATTDRLQSPPGLKHGKAGMDESEPHI